MPLQDGRELAVAGLEKLAEHEIFAVPVLGAPA